MQVKTQNPAPTHDDQAKHAAPKKIEIRQLNADDPDELELIAVRMRETLIEVLGREKGANLYTMDWLRNRVRWHLDPEKCDGRIFVATDGGRVVGHSIVRVDADDKGEPIGLFSTTYVEPKSRGRKIATALVQRGEAFLIDRGMRRLVTDTATTNVGLQDLFRKQGYTVFLARGDMLRMGKDIHAPT